MPNVLLKKLTEEEKERARQEQLQAFIRGENPLIDGVYQPMKQAAAAAAATGADLISRLLPQQAVAFESVTPNGIGDAVDRVKANKTVNSEGPNITQDQQVDMQFGSSPPATLAEVLRGRNIDSFRQIKPAPQPNRAKMLHYLGSPEVHDAAMKSERHQRGQEQLRGVLGIGIDPDRKSGFRPEKLNQQEVIDQMYEDIQSGPAPTWKSPEETMIDTHMDNQRSIIGRNNEQREGRRKYSPDAATEQQKTAARLRNKRTGQVDEMSNLGGGRGDLLIALAARDRQDLSTPEGRREAFGAAPRVGTEEQMVTPEGRRAAFAPYAGGTTTSQSGEKVRTPQRQRMLNRKQAVKDYDAKRRGAASSAIDAASDGRSLTEVLSGLPASAQRGARRAYMAEQLRQKAVEAQEKLIQAGKPDAPPGVDPGAARRAELLSLLNTQVLSKEEKERVINELLGPQPGTYGSIDDPKAGFSYNPLK